MSPITRGIRNAFRNYIRTSAIVLIVSLSIGLALAMLLANEAVEQKIATVKGSVDNTITIAPAGLRGFEGGGSPLTTAQLAKVHSLDHVTALSETLNDRLTSSDTSLKSSVSLGQLGQRFTQRFDGSAGGFGRGNFNPSTFTPPVTVIGTNDPTDLSETQGGGTFTLKSGSVFAGTSSENVALLGASLADKNSLRVGSTFTAYGKTIKVVGIFDAGNTFSNSQLIMPLLTVQNLSGQANDVTAAVATVDSVDHLAATMQNVKAALGSSADVTSSQDRTENVIAPLENVRNISAYSLVGAVAAGAIILLLVMVMIVRERRREIGVLKAVGASNVSVALQFMSEATTFTLLAAIIGIMIGVAAANPITNTLVQTSSTTTVSSTAATPGPTALRNAGRLGFQFSGNSVRQSLSTLHTSVGWNVVLYGLLAALALAIVGSSVAAWFITYIKPAEAMRAE